MANLASFVWIKPLAVNILKNGLLEPQLAPHTWDNLTSLNSSEVVIFTFLRWLWCGRRPGLFPIGQFYKLWEFCCSWPKERPLLLLPDDEKLEPATNLQFSACFDRKIGKVIFFGQISAEGGFKPLAPSTFKRPKYKVQLMVSTVFPLLSQSVLKFSRLEI